jgi:hypothetical protein
MCTSKDNRKEIGSHAIADACNNEVFYGTQYDMYDRLKNDSYVIEKYLYVMIRQLILILYDWFFSYRTVVKGRTSSIRVLSKIVKWYCCNIGNETYEMF